MKNSFYLKSIVVFLLACSLILPIAYGQAETLSLGAVSKNLLGPADFFKHSLNAVCMVLGLGFFAIAILRYMRYKENPQENPLSNVIVFFIIGVVLILLTLSYHYSYLSAVKTGVGDAVQTPN